HPDSDLPIAFCGIIHWSSGSDLLPKKLYLSSCSLLFGRHPAGKSFCGKGTQKTFWSVSSILKNVKRHKKNSRKKENFEWKRKLQYWEQVLGGPLLPVY